MPQRLGTAHPYRVSSIDRPPASRGHFDDGARSEFEAAVREAKERILHGDAFQVVLSQRLTARTEVDPFSVYRALRIVNPSPYLFFLRHPDVAVVGSSPELMTRVRDGMAFSRPIAGTRPRGASEEADRRLEEELLADPKERAEHVMLIDLARNDLGRVCEFGTVHVDDLMVIERYSHVMHIVSGVSGKLRSGVGPGRCSAGDLPARHCVRGSQGGGDEDHRRTRAGGPGALCRSGRVHRLLGQRRHRHLPPDRRDGRPSGLGSGRSRNRGRLRSVLSSTRRR